VSYKSKVKRQKSKCFYFLILPFDLNILVPNVQVSDTTGDDQRTKTLLQKKSYIYPLSKDRKFTIEWLF